MAYTPTAWVDGTTPINAQNLNKIEQALDLHDTDLDDHDARLDTLEPQVAAKLDANQAGAPLGVATLDASGKVPAAQLPSVAGIPTGSLVMWAGTAPPVGGWLLCDGSAVSRTTYAALFAAIGTAYGTGDGSTTFNLPDLRGRTAFGLGTHADVNALGKSDGLAVGSRLARHRHTVTDPGHAHTVSDPGHTHAIPHWSQAGNPGPYPAFAMVDVQTAIYYPNASGTGISVAAAPSGVTVGPAGMPLDSPAYLVVNYLIKA